jgi:hypothetical protein
MKQLKQFKAIGIAPAKQVVNYFLTIRILEWFDKANGNTYSAAVVTCNGKEISRYKSSCNQPYNLYIQILNDLNLPKYDYALLELGVRVEFQYIKSKYKELKAI